jgi:FeS assembly SUF system protein
MADNPRKPGEDVQPRRDTLPSGESSELEQSVIGVLRTIYDPEIPVDIYELGLIYDVDISSDGSVSIKMTLTSPACPVAGSLPGEVETKVLSVPGIEKVDVELVWDPPWDMDKMSEGAKLELGFL